MRPLLAALTLPFIIAANNVPNAVPLPPEKPAAESTDPAPPKDSGANETEKIDEDQTDEPEGEAEPAAPADPPPPRADEEALAGCEAELRLYGAVFKRESPIDGPGSCGIAASYEVSQILAGVSLAPNTQMRCVTALATARWLREVVIPAAKVLGDEVRVTGIRHASTYVCRGRNNQPGAKMSEHALGNAIDIRAFEFKGHAALSIEPRQRTGSVEESFQRAVRAGACLHFTTVLGPGSDSFHDDHLHLDLAARARGFRLCQ